MLTRLSSTHWPGAHSSLPIATVFIPGNWGPGGTSCAPIVTTGPAAAKLGKAGTPCSTTKKQQSRFLLTIENPTQGNQFKGGGDGSVLIGDSATANYNGMIATLQHRLSSTFSVLTNWTWSKCLNIEDAQGDLAGTIVENPNDPARDYGPCGSNYRHIVNLSLVARSGFHSMNRLERMIVNNWELAPLMQATSGAPFNVVSGGDVSLTNLGNDRPSLGSRCQSTSRSKVRQGHRRGQPRVFEPGRLCVCLSQQQHRCPDLAHLSHSRKPVARSSA